MEIKVLGTISPYLKDNMNCPGFLVSDKGFSILLDCGNGSTRYLDMLKDLKDLIVFISHFHPDHYGDLLTLMYATYTNHNLGYLDKRVPIYLPKTDKILEPTYDEEGLYNGEVFRDCLDYRYLTDEHRENYVEYREYDEKSLIKHGNMQMEFVKNPHNITTYATKIKTPDGVIVYSGDTGYKNNKLVEFAKDADILICEASYLRGFNRVNDTHLFAHEAALIAKNANVKDLYLFHTYPEIPKSAYLAEARDIFMSTHTLNEGQILKLEKRNN